MTTAPRPVVGVGVVLLRPDGLIALGHRVTAGETPSWCLPGGHLEAGETPERAGLRELAEETGVTCGQATPFAVCVRTEGSNVTFGVLAATDATTALRVTEPHAVDDWRWVRPGELPEPVFPATRAVLHAWSTPGRPLPGWDLHGVVAVERPGAGPEGCAG